MQGRRRDGCEPAHHDLELAGVRAGAPRL